MDERFCLIKAQEAEVLANAAECPSHRRAWESIAEEYRRLARAMTEQRRSVSLEDRLQA